MSVDPRVVREGPESPEVEATRLRIALVRVRGRILAHAGRWGWGADALAEIEAALRVDELERERVEGHE